MANSDKNIIITPFVNGITQPNILFRGQGNDPITLRVLDGTTGTGLTAGGALSFEGSAGQLFSIANRLGTGSIFSVNDISGIPSIDVDANGTIELAPFTGYVAIGLTAPAEKLHVIGNMRLSGGLSAASATFSGIVNCLAGMCVAAGITLSIPAGTRTHISQQGIRGAAFKIRNQVSFGFGSGDANEIDIGASGANITLAPTTNIVTIDTGLSTKTGDYQTGIRFLGYESMLGVPYNTLLIGGVGGGNTLYLPNGNGVLALSNDVVTRFNGLTGSVTGVTTGNANTFGPVQSFTNGISAAGGTFGGLVRFTSGISASGGITFHSPISSTRLSRFTSAALETKTANFSPTNADDGKVFVINHSSKTPVTVSLDGLSVGWRAKFISVNSGLVGFSSSFGTVYGVYGANGGNSQVSLLDPIVEVICYDTNLYFAG